MLADAASCPCAIASTTDGDDWAGTDAGCCSLATSVPRHGAIAKQTISADVEKR